MNFCSGTRRRALFCVKNGVQQLELITGLLSTHVISLSHTIAYATKFNINFVVYLVNVTLIFDIIFLFTFCSFAGLK